MKQLKLGLMIFILSLFSGVASSATLSQYIQKNCTTHCVDEHTLLSSTVSAAEWLDIDFRILIALAKVESGFKVNAKNGKSFGLMQVNYPVHKKKFTSSHITDPYQNVRVGAMVIKACLNRFHQNTIKAFRCYNGLGKGGDPRYTQKVVAALSEVKQLVF